LISQNSATKNDKLPLLTCNKVSRVPVHIKLDLEEVLGQGHEGEYNPVVGEAG